jgi:hypothetical protein
VYESKTGSGSQPQPMPEGCQLVAKKAPVEMTEQEMFGQSEPYRVVRNDAGAGGANALLVRYRQTASRRNFECALADPITSCPGSSGARFEVVLESYRCDAEALGKLAPNSSRP